MGWNFFFKIKKNMRRFNEQKSLEGEKIRKRIIFPPVLIETLEYFSFLLMIVIWPIFFSLIGIFDKNLPCIAFYNIIQRWLRLTMFQGVNFTVQQI